MVYLSESVKPVTGSYDASKRQKAEGSGERQTRRRHRLAPPLRRVRQAFRFTPRSIPEYRRTARLCTSQRRVERTPPFDARVPLRSILLDLRRHRLRVCCLRTRETRRALLAAQARHALLVPARRFRAIVAPVIQQIMLPLGSLSLASSETYSSGILQPIEHTLDIGMHVMGCCRDLPLITGDRAHDKWTGLGRGRRSATPQTTFDSISSDVLATDDATSSAWSCRSHDRSPSEGSRSRVRNADVTPEERRAHEAAVSW